MRRILVFLGVIVPLVEVLALPRYSFRSARVCDNCHSTPFETSKQAEWKNPKLADRKCNLSCQSCHVNPAGGGMRTAPGRYYAMSTLPMFGAKKRPYHDATKNREIRQVLRFLAAKGLKKQKSEQAVAMVEPQNEMPVPPPELDAEARARWLAQFEPKFFYSEDFLSFGGPLDALSIEDQSKYAFDRDRYGPINADPFFSMGLNARLAYVANDISAVFPMQFDTGAALHPVEHLTLSATTGFQGRTGGFEESINDKRNNPMKIQNAFVMIHELPYAAYLQAGLFLPEFGLRVEDHTAYGRRYFEMDTVFTNKMARGVQVGAAPNYPYFSAAVFETVNQSGKVTGHGYTANVAYRGIPAGIGLSYMQKNRPLDSGGDLKAASVNGYYNLWHLFTSTRYTHPVIMQYEYNLGRKARSDTGLSGEKFYSTWLLQFDYLVLNGLNLRLGHMYYDEDLEVKDDGEHRVFTGVDWGIYRGFRFTAELRQTLPVPGQASSEILLFLHGYL